MYDESGRVSRGIITLDEASRGGRGETKRGFSAEI